MGAHTCEFGVVHKRCRCMKGHTIKCDVPTEHGGTLHVAGTSNTHAPCWRMASGRLGKHENHPSHLWWYTSEGGGHYLMEAPDDTDNPNKAKMWICPGNEDNNG